MLPKKKMSISDEIKEKAETERMGLAKGKEEKKSVKVVKVKKLGKVEKTKKKTKKTR